MLTECFIKIYLQYMKYFAKRSTHTDRQKYNRSPLNISSSNNTVMMLQKFLAWDETFCLHAKINYIQEPFFTWKLSCFHLILSGVFIFPLSVWRTGVWRPELLWWRRTEEPLQVNNSFRRGYESEWSCWGGGGVQPGSCLEFPYKLEY